MDENINNLFNLYRETGASPSVSFLEKGQFSVVSGQNNNWPQMVFELDLYQNPASNLEQILTESTGQNLPGFAVCDANLFDKQALYSLREKEIYPVKTWTLMEMQPLTTIPNQREKNYDIRKLTTPDEIHAFTILVNTELMQSIKIAPALAEELQVKGAFAFYGLFRAEELISCLLTYSDSQTTGLYFVVTKQAFRGKGLAAELIRHVTSLYGTKTKKVVLQATQKAVPLYTRLDFSTRGKLVIFWKR